MKIPGGKVGTCKKPEAGKTLACFLKAAAKWTYFFIFYFVSSLCARANGGHNLLFLLKEKSDLD